MLLIPSQMRTPQLGVVALFFAVAWATPTPALAGGTADGFLQIGTTMAPASMLGVYGGQTIGTSYFSTGAPANGLLVQGSVGIGTTSPYVSLDLHSRTDALALPVGTTGQEPTNSLNGMIRYNTTLTDVEAYIGGYWTTLTTGSGGTSSNYLGTSKAVPDMAASATDTQTGLYTAGAGKVDITSANTQIAEFSASGFNVLSGIVGIGTASPGSNAGLAVTKGIVVGTSYAYVAQAAPSNGAIIQGNVGIGTATAYAPLTVIGTGNISSTLTMGTALIGTSVAQGPASLTVNGTGATTNGVVYAYNNSDSGGTQVALYGYADDSCSSDCNGANPVGVYGWGGVNQGNGTGVYGVGGTGISGVGGSIGVSGSTANTAGSGVAGSMTGANNTGFAVSGNNSGGGAVTNYGGYFTTNATGAAAAGLYGSITGVSNTGYAVQAVNNSANGWGVYASGTSPNYFMGNVGIGTATAYAPLTVVGTANIAGAATLTGGAITPKVSPATDSTTAVQITKAGGSTNVVDVDTTNSRVGVGTAAPQATLDINGYVRLALNTTQPAACSTGNDGSIALTHTHNTCVCVGTSAAWVSTVTGATCAW
jgi:collagen type VII alpha